MRIVWTPRAVRHLSRIAEYIGQHDAGAAERTLRTILKCVARLEVHPLSARPGRVARTRELVVPRTRYIVAYRVGEDQVEIVGVIHDAQDWPKKF